MLIETLRNSFATLLAWDADIVGNRELLVTPSFHGYSATEVTEVVIGLRGTPPRYCVVLSNMYSPWEQRGLLHVEKRFRNGARKQMVCALVDRQLVATGYGVNYITPYPPMHLLPKQAQKLRLPNDFG